MAHKTLAEQGVAERRKRDLAITSAQGGSTSRKPSKSTPTFTQGSDQREKAPKPYSPSPRDPRKAPQPAKPTAMSATAAYALLKREQAKALAKAKAKADAEKKMLTDAGRRERLKKHPYRG